MDYVILAALPMIMCKKLRIFCDLPFDLEKGRNLFSVFFCACGSQDRDFLPFLFEAFHNIGVIVPAEHNHVLFHCFTVYISLSEIGFIGIWSQRPNQLDPLFFRLNESPEGVCVLRDTISVFPCFDKYSLVRFFDWNKGDFFRKSFSFQLIRKKGDFEAIQQVFLGPIACIRDPDHLRDVFVDCVDFVFEASLVVDYAKKGQFLRIYKWL